MSEWIGDHWRDVLNIVGFLVTAGGFTLGFWQLRKIRNATEAAQQALRETAHRLSLNQLLVLTTQLLQVEQDLEEAVRGDETMEVVRVLIRWRQLASQLRGRIPTHDSAQEPLLSELANAIPQTVKAVEALGSNVKDLRNATKRARSAIAGATNEISALMAQLTMNSGAIPEEER